jgi:tetratricopeptide (TPR) repeat protein
MRLQSTMPKQQTVMTRSLTERVQAVCAQAKQLEEAGEFQAAREALNEFWQRIGERPKVDGLNPEGQAEVLLRTGALSGWIGSALQVTGAQEIAKDLISESARIFEICGLRERVAEARVDLAICYWREGAFDEARVSLADALQQLGDLESEQRLRVLLNKAIVDTMSLRFEDALRTHREAAPMFDMSSNVALKGKFHNEYATLLKNLGLARNSADLIDHALVEYSAATVYAEEVGNKRFLASVENNVGNLFVRLDRFDEAHKHLDRARLLFTSLKDKSLVAQVDDSRARALISQGQVTKAEVLSRAAVKVLAEGDELSLLAEALTTHGTALARLGNYSKARATLEKALRTAHTAGDPESAGVAALSMVEELTEQMPSGDLFAYYGIAETELTRSQHPGIQSRLGRCARRLLATQAFHGLGGGNDTANQVNAGSELPAEASASAGETVLSNCASLEEQVLHYEGQLIRRALQSSEGSVTRAARTLGITHQGLAFILNGRHKDLLAARKPVKKRRRSIIRYH